MNIAIIGAGNVGGTLGGRWAKGGHKVIFGSRKPDDPKMKKVLEAAGSNARAASVSEAAQSSDVIVLTTPWDVAHDAIKSAGNLSGKILVDVTNPLASTPDTLKRGLVIGHTTSAGEQVAGWAKGARTVKAFNTTGFPNMANPAYGQQKASMFICGDDAEAKNIVKSLSDELGFETFDAGPITSARYLESLAMLWINLAVNMGWGPNFVFKVLKR